MATALSDITVSVGWLIAAKHAFPTDIVTAADILLGVVKAVGTNNVYGLNYRVVCLKAIQITIASTTYMIIKESDVIFSLAPES